MKMTMLPFRMDLLSRVWSRVGRIHNTCKEKSNNSKRFYIRSSGGSSVVSSAAFEHYEWPPINFISKN